MSEKSSLPLPPVATGAPAPQTVAPGTAPGAPAGTPAAQSVPLFGGHRGGRPRKDGLPAGSEAAREADRRADMERKRISRARPADPAPLPAAGVESSAAAAPGGPQIIQVENPAVPWNADDLRPLFDELTNTWEEARTNGLVDKARDAKLPDTLVREIKKDAAFPAAAKRGLGIGSAEVVAKWANKAGLSAEYKPELILLSCLTSILAQGAKLNAKLEKVCEAANPNSPPPPPGTAGP